LHTQLRKGTQLDDTEQQMKHSEKSKGAVTKNGNPRVCAHRTYKLTCLEFDDLENRARGRCERCGTTGGQLVIDHDHARGVDAVRGLLCHGCNQHLRRVDNGRIQPDEQTRHYLSRPFREGGKYNRWDTSAKPSVVKFDGASWDAACALAAKRGDDILVEITKFLKSYVSQGG